MYIFILVSFSAAKWLRSFQVKFLTQTTVSVHLIVRGNKTNVQNHKNDEASTLEDIAILEKLEGSENSRLFLDDGVEEAEVFQEAKTDQQRQTKNKLFVDEAPRLAEIDVLLFSGNVR